MKDVLPLSIGFKSSQRLLDVYLPKNTPYGQSCFREYVTSRDYQKQMKIHVGQGEYPFFNDNDNDFPQVPDLYPHDVC